MAALGKDSDKFSETRIDDEYVVMMLDSGDFLSLAGTAGVIWSLIDGTRGRDAILDELALQYAAPPEEIAADLDAFLATLKDNGLLIAG